MKFLSGKYDSLLCKVEERDCDIAALKKRVDHIESGTSPAITKIRLKLNQMEQHRLWENIKILGLARQEPQDFFEKVHTVARKFEFLELT